MHPWDLSGLLNVDGDNARVGIGAPHHRDMEQSRQRQVVSVQHLPADFQLTIDTGPTPALWWRLGIGKSRGHTHLLSVSQGIMSHLIVEDSPRAQASWPEISL